MRCLAPPCKVLKIVCEPCLHTYTLPFERLACALSAMGLKRKISDVDHDPATLQPRAPPVYSDWERDRRFGIVVDAGSSGSRLQVYSWIDHKVAREQRKARGDGVAVLPKIQKGVEHGEAWTLKVEPGEANRATRRILTTCMLMSVLLCSRHIVAG